MRAKKEFLSLSLANTLFFLILLFLPTQLGKHFWPNFSTISGIRVDYLSPTLYFTDILIFLLFAYWIYKRRQVSKPNFLSLLLLAVFVLGIAFSVSSLAGIYYLIKIAEFSFLGFYVAKSVNKNQILIPLSLGIIVESLLAIFQYLNVGSLGGAFYFLGERAFNSQTPGIANASVNGQLILRPYSTFSHPNVLAAYLVFGMTTAIFLIKNPRVKMPILFLGTLALILTLSRTAILVWVFIFGFYFFKKYFVLFFGLCVLVLLLSPLHSRFAALTLSDEAVSYRISLSKDAWEMFLKSPILGVGLNNFLQNLDKAEQRLSQAFLIQPVHNIFLLTLSETGVLGFALVFYGFFETLRINFKEKKIYHVVLLALVIFLGSFDHYFLTLQQGQMMFALIFGIAWSDTIS